MFIFHRYSISIKDLKGKHPIPYNNLKNYRQEVSTPAGATATSPAKPVESVQ